MTEESVPSVPADIVDQLRQTSQVDTIRVKQTSPFDPKGKQCTQGKKYEWVEDRDDRGPFMKQVESDPGCQHPAYIAASWAPGHMDGFKCKCCYRKSLERRLENIKKQLEDLPHEIEELPLTCEASETSN